MKDTTKFAANAGAKREADFKRQEQKGSLSERGNGVEPGERPGAAADRRRQVAAGACRRAAQVSPRPD